MKTVAAIYTAQALIEPTRMLFAELMPDHRLINLYDDSLIPDVMNAGNSVTTDVRRRMLAYCSACEDMGADVILSTCSSMGDVVDQIRPFTRIPILKIDEPMVRLGVETGSSIAVMMTNPTTRLPTIRLVRTIAEELGKQVNIIEGLAKGAFQALLEGKPEAHNELLLQAAIAVAGTADVILLAQGSMAPLQEAIAKVTGKTVLSSPRLGLMSIKAFLENTQ